MKKTINALPVTYAMKIKLNHYIQYFLKHVNSYAEQTKWMYLLIEHDDLLEKI